MFATSSGTADRDLCQMPLRSMSNTPTEYQSSLDSRLGYADSGISAADGQPTPCRMSFMRSATASQCLATDYQGLVHQIGGGAPSDNPDICVSRRPNMQQERLTYGDFRPEPVSPTSRQTQSQAEVDHDPASEEEEEDDEIITADEQDYDREGVNDGAFRTAEEIRAEKRKMKRFRYHQAGDLENPLAYINGLDSLINRPASFRENLLVRPTRMQRSESDCQNRFRVSVLDKSKSGFKTGKTLG